MNIPTITSAVKLVLIVFFTTAPIYTHAAGPDYRQSVVKIFVKSQRDSYSMPWQSSRPIGGTGSGFIIDKKRILTNAHVVSDARVIEVQKAGDARKWAARVKYIGHDCDLAMLEVQDDAFYENTRPMSLSKNLPRLDDEVVVVGFPLGGDHLSVTRGIVSRIDYSSYSHSGIDEHLALQVDAAINPGNSGGPVLYKGRIVGVAFQGLRSADNIGYAIPTPVIKHFLADVADDNYNGYPDLGAYYLNLENEGLRDDLKLTREQNGVITYYIDPYGAAHGHLKEKDILISIDGHDIANDGTVKLDDNQMLFSELLERKLWGDSVTFDIIRAGQSLQIKVPLKNREDPFVFRNIYDEHPEYFMVSGLVFSPLSREHIRLLSRSIGTRSRHHLLYYTRYAKVDKLNEGRKEFIVLIKRLPHPTNTYLSKFEYQLVSHVNGQKISELKDIKSALSTPLGDFHVFEFEGHEDNMVLNAKSSSSITQTIMQSYGVPAREYFKTK